MGYIAREKPKCRPKADTGKVKMPSDVQARVDDLEKRYSELVKKSEKMADESVEKSKEYMNMAIEAKEEMDSLRAKHKVDGFQGEAVCEVCGVKYPLGGGGADWHDETSHWKGKAHTGYTEIRATVGRLRNKRKEWDKYRDKIESNKRRIKDKEREKDRQKEKRRKLERE